MTDMDHTGMGMLADEQEIYRENILDHFKHPHHAGVLHDATHHHRELNPLCGDEIEVYLKVSGSQTIEDVRFVGKGCAISQASISMLTDAIIHVPVDTVGALTKDDILDMLGIPVSAVRMKCALLALDTLQNGIKIYEQYVKKK